MNEQIKINWYRCKVDKKVMSELMKTSNTRGLLHVVPQLLFFVFTGLVAYWTYTNIHASNWAWAVPLMLLALWVHGSFSSFLGMGGPVHELCHKTPFRSKWLNEFVLRVYSFLSWSDYVGFRASHVKHHQVTVHSDLDGEVVLPGKLDWKCFGFFFKNFICDPIGGYKRLRDWAWGAVGPEETRLKGWPDWIKLKVMPITNVAMRREHRRWLQIVLFGQLAIAAIFIATGHWFLVIVFNFPGFYAGWGTAVVGIPQHLGLSPNVPDFRLCCRTYTCSWVPAFFYWNMQYHIEHHMFPAVPFYNLPRLHEAVAYDMPKPTRGLWATWMELFPIIERQRREPDYVFIPDLPRNAGDSAGDDILEAEAAQMA